MERVTLFTTDIYQLHVDNVINHALYFKQFVDELSTHQHVNTDYYSKTVYKLPEDLKQTILDNSSKILGSDKIKIKKYWLQDYKTDQYHGLHTHGQSIMSGVYYLKYSGSGGNIVFQNPNSVQWATSTGPFEKRVQPQAGMMLLFPGWMPHRVEPIQDTVKERTVLSFNIVKVET